MGSLIAKPMVEYEVQFVHVVKKRFKASDINDAARTVRLLLAQADDSYRVHSIIPTQEAKNG